MDAQRYWRRQGRRVALRYNFGWWLAAFLNYLAFSTAGFACVLLILRQSGIEAAEAWIGFAAAALVCALVAWLRTRRKFFAEADGLVRLDVELGLNNRLVSAAAGVGEYPEVRHVADGWKWRWWRVLAPLAGCAALLLAAAWIPIASSSAAASVQLPSAWAQVESWAEQLEKEDVVDPEALDDLREKLETLKDKPKEEWYSQSALEAGESLREQSGDAIRALQRDMQTAAMVVSAVEQFSEQMSSAEIKSAQAALDKALQGLELGRMPLNRELLAQLKNADLSRLKTLSAEQLAKMQQRLKLGIGVCKSCVGTKPGEGIALLAAFSGTGGIQRGPGTVPLQLSPRATELNSQAAAGLSGGDLDRALPGDVVGMASGEHKVDAAAYAGPVAAGTASAGRGGDAVWRDDLTPEEREMLKQFFK